MDTYHLRRELEGGDKTCCCIETGKRLAWDAQMTLKRKEVNLEGEADECGSSRWG